MPSRRTRTWVPPSSGRSRGRPRSAATERAIFEAASSLLKKKGFFEFSLAEVALDAAVSRTSIYRRWPNKLALVFSLLDPHFKTLSFLPSENESLPHVLGLLLRRLVALQKGPWGRIFFQVLASCKTHPPSLKAFRAQFLLPCRAQARTLLLWGVNRGEIRRDADLTLASDALVGPLLFASAFGDKIPEELIDALVALVLRGLQVEAASALPTETRGGKTEDLSHG